MQVFWTWYAARLLMSLINSFWCDVAETELSDKQVWPNGSTYSINVCDLPPNELAIPSTQSSGSAYKI